MIEEEVEQTLLFSQGAKDKHSTRLLKIFNQEDEAEMTTTLKPIAERELYIIDFIGLCEELESLEKRAIVKSLHIQQIRLETDGGAYQPQEQLDGVGLEKTQGERAATKLSHVEVEKNLSDKTTELNFAEEWPASPTEEGNNRGDHDDLPTGMTKLQKRRLHTGNQPWEQLDEVIEEIRRLMIRSTEAVNNEKLSRRGPTRAVGQQQQQQQGKGADRQLQRIVWDPGGFQKRCRGAHDQEIMIFPAEEYDARASL
jgi:hypothetical protein